MASDTIRVFQTLTLPALDDDTASRLREAVIAQASEPWRRNVGSEERLRKNATSQDILIFDRLTDAITSLPDCSLMLVRWTHDYEASNIIAHHVQSLSQKVYNAILQDFVVKIALPASDSVGTPVKLSQEFESPHDWLSPESESELRIFEIAANKASGSSHPMDKKRWLRFLTSAHRHNDKMTAEKLNRWLVEAQGWLPEVAERLSEDYDFGRELLKQYDQ